MKKILKTIILLLILNISFVKSADFTTSASGNGTITAGGTVTITFKANSNIGLMGIRGSLSYDKNLLELTSSKAGSGYALTMGSLVVLDRAEPPKDKNGNLIKTFTFMTLKFKAKSSFSVGSNTTITLSNVTGSDGTRTLSGSTSKLTVKVASSDNNLSNLTIDSKQISGFKSSTTSYKMVVKNTVSKVTIGATASDSGAKVSGTGTKNLSIYNNTFRVNVTSAAGTTKTYTIVIVRKDANGYAGARSKDNKLKSLTIEGYEIPFDPATNEYELSVKNEVTNLDVKAVANDSSAKVDITNNPLNVGLNKIVIKVTAEDESKNEYVINVTRKNDNPTVTIDKFKDIVDATTKDTIEVLVGNKEIITKENLEMIRSSKKNVIFAYYEDNKLIYAWHLLNEDIKTDVEFDTNVSFESANAGKINEITNYAEAFYVTSANKNKSKVKLKVLTNLKEKSKLYYFDGKIHLQSDKIEVDKDSYVEFPFENNEYFLSRMEVKKNVNGLAIILGAENIIIAGFCIYLIIKKAKEKNVVGE